MPPLTPAVRMGVSIALAVGVYGISFGALSVAAGLTIAQTIALSALMFTGGSQFAFVGVVGGGGSFPAALAASSLLGLRNGVYAVGLDGMLHPRGLAKILYAHLTIDESMATASAQDSVDEQRRGFFTAGVGVFITWNLFTALGAFVGAGVDAKQFGLDGAAVAAFAGLLWPRLKDADAWATAALCGVVTALLVPAVPPGIPIVVAGGVAFALASWQHRRSA